MKKLLLLSILLYSALGAHAQLFGFGNEPAFQRKDGSVLDLALAGGMNQPQFSQMHLNSDTFLDLVVFDRSGGKVSCFLAAKNGGTVSYTYAPELEIYFPKRQEFMFLEDYDHDGKNDLWTYNGMTGKVELHRNTSGTHPQFTYVTNLRAYNFNNPPFDTSDFVQFKGNFPDVVDLDGDGDMDYVSNTAYCGSNITYYWNNTLEQGRSLGDIGFSVVDYCLGGLGEDGVDVILDAPCFYQRHYQNKKHCGVKSLCFFDNDNDGDLDLFFGTSEEPTDPIYFVENGKADHSWPYDTFIRLDSAYFPATVEPLIPVAPSSSLVDIDLDGEMDLILSTNEVLTYDYKVEETHNVLYFHNNGQTELPDFDYRTNTFLVGDMVDHGAHTDPELVDLNDDGLLDLLVATNGDDAFTDNKEYHVVCYMNVGSALKAVFKLHDSDYLQLRTFGLPQFDLASGDLDGDGDPDILLGMQDGSMQWIKNTGTPQSAQFDAPVNNYQSIDVGEYASPTIHDLDGDGLLDLIIGEYDGPINYYRNTGSSSSPAFTLITDSLGGILTNELVTKTYFDPDRGLYDTLEYLFYGNSTPQFVELGDTLYLLASGADGHIRAYHVPQDLSDTFPCDSDFMRAMDDRPNYTKDWGALAKVTGGDLDNDGYDDLLIGTNRGGLHYLHGLETTGIQQRYRQAHFSLYPNPSTGTLHVGVSQTSMRYEIVDVRGRLVQGGVLYGKQLQLSTELQNGLYFLHLYSAGKEYLPQKFILQR